MNIEEFVNDYLQEHRHEVLLNPYNGLVEFAKVFQEKLMEEAVEGYILGEIRNQEDEPYEIYAESDFLPLNGKFKMGDKVKIIIVKEEGKHV